MSNDANPARLKIAGARDFTNFYATGRHLPARLQMHQASLVTCMQASRTLLEASQVLLRLSRACGTFLASSAVNNVIQGKFANNTGAQAMNDIQA